MSRNVQYKNNIVMLYIKLSVYQGVKRVVTKRKTQIKYKNGYHC